MLTLICVTDIRHMRFRLNSSSVLAWICFPLAWAGVPIFDSSAARHRLSSNFLFLQAMRVHTPLFPAPYLSGVHLFPREDECERACSYSAVRVAVMHEDAAVSWFRMCFFLLRLTLHTAGWTPRWARVTEIPDQSRTCARVSFAFMDDSLRITGKHNF